jgi:hypothetical protein
MEKHLSSKIIMLAVAALLCINLVIAFFSNSMPSYAARGIQYRIMNARSYTYSGEKGLEKILNRYGNEGWDIAAIYGDIIIFKK